MDCTDGSDEDEGMCRSKKADLIGLTFSCDKFIKKIHKSFYNESFPPIIFFTFYFYKKPNFCLEYKKPGEFT